ncbi:transcriptional regulator, partial [Klebsiella pneumoniae]
TAPEHMQCPEFKKIVAKGIRLFK